MHVTSPQPRVDDILFAGTYDSPKLLRIEILADLKIRWKQARTALIDSVDQVSYGMAHHAEDYVSNCMDLR
jgi:hypothetical protein